MIPFRFSLVAAVLVVSATFYTFAADRDFDGLISQVARTYDAHATGIPLMSMVSLCARVATHGGVKGLRVAEFDHLKAALDEPELTSLLRKNLGPEWQPFINERNQREGSQSVIFVQPEGNGLHMLIADYEHGELDLVRMDLNGDALAKWMSHPQGPVPGSR
jgi:hypothetical protein